MLAWETGSSANTSAPKACWREPSRCPLSIPASGEDPGDTRFFEDQVVDKWEFMDVNDELYDKGNGKKEWKIWFY